MRAWGAKSGGEPLEPEAEKDAGAGGGKGRSRGKGRNRGGDRSRSREGRWSRGRSPKTTDTPGAKKGRGKDRAEPTAGALDEALDAYFGVEKPKVAKAGAAKDGAETLGKTSDSDLQTKKLDRAKRFGLAVPDSDEVAKAPKATSTGNGADRGPDPEAEKKLARAKRFGGEAVRESGAEEAADKEAEKPADKEAEKLLERQKRFAKPVQVNDEECKVETAEAVETTKS